VGIERRQNRKTSNRQIQTGLNASVQQVRAADVPSNKKQHMATRYSVSATETSRVQDAKPTDNACAVGVRVNQRTHNVPAGDEDFRLLLPGILRHGARNGQQKHQPGCGVGAQRCTGQCNEHCVVVVAAGQMICNRGVWHDGQGRCNSCVWHTTTK